MSIATLDRKGTNGARYAQYHKMEKAKTLEMAMILSILH